MEIYIYIYGYVDTLDHTVGEFKVINHNKELISTFYDYRDAVDYIEELETQDNQSIYTIELPL
jgi:hypothetical protein